MEILSCYSLPINVSFLSQKELIEGDKTSCLERDLTLEKLLEAKLIFIPVVANNHWSLVAVNTALRKIFMLDSYQGIHKQELKDSLVDRLVAYSRSKFRIDIGYEKQVLEVAQQKNM